MGKSAVHFISVYFEHYHFLQSPTDPKSPALHCARSCLPIALYHRPTWATQGTAKVLVMRSHLPRPLRWLRIPHLMISRRAALPATRRWPHPPLVCRRRCLVNRSTKPRMRRGSLVPTRWGFVHRPVALRGGCGRAACVHWTDMIAAIDLGNRG